MLQALKTADTVEEKCRCSLDAKRHQAPSGCAKRGAAGNTETAEFLNSGGSVERLRCREATGIELYEPHLTVRRLRL
jgi:hypothetical protein